MRLIRTLAVSAALASMAVAPVMAQAGSASSLSLRASTAAKSGNDIKGSTVLVGLLALTAVISGAIIATKGPNRPTSP